VREEDPETLEMQVHLDLQEKMVHLEKRDLTDHQERQEDKDSREQEDLRGLVVAPVQQERKEIL